MEIREIIEIAQRFNASDIHITVGVPPILRIDGQLMPINNYPIISSTGAEDLALQLLDDEKGELIKSRGEIDFSYSIRGLGRFRVNIYKQRGSFSIAMRAIPLTVPTLDELGLPEVIKELLANRKGLILVTGPTGSGKSTTLAAMINEINNTRCEHIITLEDPIEYLHKHKKSIVNQREIGNDTRSFGEALRAALRQDPDVILIGEMRDLETISTAITAAETGHLVLSTLHTTSAVSTVDRIIDVFPPHQQQHIRIQLSNVLQGVISQQLLRRAKGRGRVAAVEVMICNAAIRNHIREGKTHQIMSSMQTGGKLGMNTMDNAIKDLYKSGLIDYDEAIKYAVDSNYLSKLL